MAFIDQTMEKYADCDASLKEINSAMDKEILEVRKKYGESITRLQQQKEQAFNKMEAFAVENQELLFSIKRSFKSKMGVFGFRTGKARLVLDYGATWEKITTLLKGSLPDYVRIVYEPAKDKLLNDFYQPEVQTYVPAMGLSVTKDETFYIDLKK